MYQVPRGPPPPLHVSITLWPPLNRGSVRRKYLDLDIGLSGEPVEQAVQKGIVLAMTALDTLKKLVFVANLIDSLKVCVCVCVFTHGSWIHKY